MSVLKEIKTAAQGTVKLRLRFENPGASGQLSYGGEYLILVNGLPDGGGEFPWVTITNSMLNTNIFHSRDLNLKQPVNFIEIALKTASNNQAAVNTTFEILCRDDPKFLALLG
jgi:hypothetical protein